VGRAEFLDAVPGSRPQPAAPVFASVEVRVERRPDGTAILTNQLPLGPYPVSLLDRLDHWAAVRPQQSYLGERRGEGWRTLSYGAARAAVQELAARLLGLPLSQERPLLIVAPNGIEHALLMLAAMRIGVPISVISPTAARDARRLAHVLEILTPGALFLGDGLEALQPPSGAATADLIRIAAVARQRERVVALADLPAEPSAAVDAAFGRVHADTTAKLLFTSGSTGTPKAVITTQRMLCSNAAALAGIWPFLRETPPVLVDWLPWSHVFGGNCCFNLALFYGGTFYIDDGTPLANGIERTVRNLKDISPNMYFNVPMGYEALLTSLERDAGLARTFFGSLKFLFSAGAAMPDRVRARLHRCAEGSAGRAPPIIGAWGSTETAPFATAVYFDTPHADNIGVPMPGTAIKLAPDGGKFELRVKGPNVFPAYRRDPTATAAAFDDEGYYRMGDAGQFADPERPEFGLRFDGRIAENFKLASGTWVNVGALRLGVLECAMPLIADAVLTGHGRDGVGALLFPELAQCRSFLGHEAAELGAEQLVSHPRLIEAIRTRLLGHHRQQSGSSTRIERFRLTAAPPNRLANEITEKGSLNQRAVLAARAGEVDALYADGGHEVVPTAHSRRELNRSETPSPSGGEGNDDQRT
jgi:feruloyl-CoA synthase